MSDANAIVERLGALFVEGLHIKVPSADTDLFETGILDSLQLVELLLLLERQFGFRIAVEDIDLDNLRTLARIARLVAARAPKAGHQIVQPSSSEVRQAAANQPELQPRGTESRAGRIETNRKPTTGSPRDCVPAGPPLPSGSVR